jgi:hypothetical protein
MYVIKKRLKKKNIMNAISSGRFERGSGCIEMGLDVYFKLMTMKIAKKGRHLKDK